MSYKYNIVYVSGVQLKTIFLNLLMFLFQPCSAILDIPDKKSYDLAIDLTPSDLKLQVLLFLLKVELEAREIYRHFLLDVCILSTTRDFMSSGIQ